MVKTIDDFKIVLDGLLRAQNLKANYQVHTVDAKNVSPPLPVSWLRTQTFVINYFDPVVYEVWYKISDAVILQRLMPYITAAAVLLALIIAMLLLFRRSLQIQHEINSFRSSLFSNATHELKTPLTSLQLIVESFRPNEGGDFTLSQRNVSFAKAEIERMKLLVSRILSYGRMDKEQLSIDKKNVHLDPIVKDAIAALDLIIQQNAVSINYTPETKISTFGDPVLLTNMMTSLIENVIKHTGSEAHVTIDSQRKSDEILIRVSDNGPGIDSKFHKRIFEPFFRVPAIRAEEKAEHGLGLSFAMQVAQLHGGSIGISSEPGHGSTFIVYLPSSIKNHE
jgi:signal transduction histidine kinase